jgi:hypothetical protein
MRGFPAGFPVDTSRLVENYQTPIPGQTERVITYDSTSSAASLRQRYLDWLAAHDYEVVKEKNAEVAASLAALNKQQKDLIVLIFPRQSSQGSRVQVITHY